MGLCTERRRCERRSAHGACLRHSTRLFTARRRLQRSGGLLQRLTVDSSHTSRLGPDFHFWLASHKASCSLVGTCVLHSAHQTPGPVGLPMQKSICCVSELTDALLTQHQPICGAPAHLRVKPPRVDGSVIQRSLFTEDDPQQQSSDLVL